MPNNPTQNQNPGQSKEYKSSDQPQTGKKPGQMEQDRDSNPQDKNRTGSENQ